MSKRSMLRTSPKRSALLIGDRSSQLLTGAKDSHVHTGGKLAVLVSGVGGEGVYVAPPSGNAGQWWFDDAANSLQVVTIGVI